MLSTSIREGRGREKPSSKEGWASEEKGGGGAEAKQTLFARWELFPWLLFHYAHIENAAMSRVERGLPEFSAFGLSASVIRCLFWGKKSVLIITYQR